MVRFRSAWLVTWCGIAVLGWGLALVLWDLADVLLIFAFAAGSAALLWSCAISSGTEAGLLKERLRRMVTIATGAGAAAVAVVAAAASFPVLTAVLMVLAVASSPVCVSRLGRRLRAHRGAGGWHRPQQRLGWTLAAETTAEALTDVDLCRAWVSSFDALQSATDSSAVERVVILRQSYLDELERRNPGALAAWLDSGARATSSPDRFLRGDT